MPFTEREQRLLQRGMLDDEPVNSMSWLAIMASMYISETGEAPKSALDLLTNRYPEMQIGPDMPRDELFRKVGNFFNPATGKLLTELNDLRWRPYGVAFEIAPAALNPYTRPGKLADSGYRMVIYGAEEGTVLYDKTYYTSPTDTSSPQAQTQPLKPVTLNFEEVPEIDADVLAYYLSLDFSPELKELTPVTVDDQAYSQEEFFFSVNQPSLTERDRKYLAQYNFTHRNQQHCVELTGALYPAQLFFRKYGRLPENGVELMLLKNSSLLTPQGMAQFKQLDRMAQLAEVYQLIDPLTGRFIDSFTTDGWQPHSIHITALLPGMWLPDTKFTSLKDELNLPDMSAGIKWVVTVYGEEEGSVLMERDWVIFQ
jgi:hypothetical protein